MASLRHSISHPSVFHVWLRALAAGAELAVRRNGSTVEHVQAPLNEESLRQVIAADTPGDYSLDWDPSTVTVELAYVYRPNFVLDEGITQLLVSESNERPPHIPAYHFTPPWGWINDPNGMCVVDGRIHMFYQHMPLLRRRKRTMIYWGHATSRDGLNWTHLPIFLAPRDELLRDPTKSGGAYSGSAIPLPGGKGLRIFFTDREDDRLPDREWQQTLTTTDLIAAGPTETLIAERPNVTGIRNDFRDPYVFKGPDGLWKMTLGSRTNAGGVVLLYETTDATASGGWTFVQPIFEVSSYGLGPAECPCLLPLGTDDLWVLVISLISHDKPTRRRNISLAVVGRFDGRSFEPVHTQEVDYGTDAYAFQGWLDAEGPVGLCWAANWAEISRDVDYFSAFTLARRLVWRGDHLATPPAFAPERLRAELLGQFAGPATASLTNGAAEISIELSPEAGPLRVTIDVPGEHVVFDVSDAGMRLEYGTAPDAPHYGEPGRPTKLTIFVDIGMVEIYADDGRWCFTKRISTWSPARAVRIEGAAVATKVWSLNTTKAALTPVGQGTFSSEDSYV